MISGLFYQKWKHDLVSCNVSVENWQYQSVISLLQAINIILTYEIEIIDMYQNVCFYQSMYQNLKTLLIPGEFVYVDLCVDIIITCWLWHALCNSLFLRLSIKPTEFQRWGAKLSRGRKLWKSRQVCPHCIQHRGSYQKNWRQARDLKPRDFVRGTRSFFHEGFICLEFELLDLSLKVYMQERLSPSFTSGLPSLPISLCKYKL